MIGIIINVKETKQTMIGNIFTMYVLKVQYQSEDEILEYKISKKNVFQNVYENKSVVRTWRPPECGSSGKKITAVE